MYSLSVKKIFANLVRKTLKDPALKIKTKTTQIYNNIVNNVPNLNMTQLYQYCDDCSEDIKILILDNGNYLIISNSFKTMKILNKNTYNIINTIRYISYFDSITSLISLGKNQILFCDSKFNIGYIEFDNDYNIINTFSKNFNLYYYLNSSCLKLLKNGNIVYMGSRNTYKKGEEQFGLGRLYFLKLDKINNSLILENEIKVYNPYIYQIKSRDEYLINIKNNFVSVVNSNNFNVKKEYKFDINFNMKLLNDEYSIQSEHGEIKLYKLDNFELIKSITSNHSNNILKIFVVDKNLFFTFEGQKADILKGELFVKKWQFNEEEKDIICLGKLKIDNLLYNIEKIKGSENIYLFLFTGNFKIIQI